MISFPKLYRIGLYWFKNISPLPVSCVLISLKTDNKIKNLEITKKVIKKKGAKFRPTRHFLEL